MIRFRADIEGLRAVAVLLVIFDHLQTPGFRGGFVGVDVFFVISGYLITSLLAAEYGKKADERHGYGSISIPRFYLRRARRILPAALTVILAVAVASRLLLNPLRVDQVQHDALWALFFGSNINSINQATDYFAQGLAASPYEHYWSLAVEEQFYLVWPALFLLVTMVHGLHVFGVAIGWRVRVGVTIAGVGIASLAWSTVATANNPASAYYSTFTRAWELALGALIGIIATRATQLSRPLATLSSFAGAALLLIGCVLIDTSTAFPGTAALLPTFAAALFILGGLSAKPPLPNRALCLAPLRFLGRISYSLYLWHWPLIVFAAALYPTRSNELTTRLVILALTLVISTLSFYLIEKPGRRISFTRWENRRRHEPGWLRTNLDNVAFGACVLVAVFAGGLATIYLAEGTTPVASAEPQGFAAIPDLVGNSPPATPTASSVGTQPARSRPPKPGTSKPSETRYLTVLRAWQEEVRAALAIQTLPKSLQPLESHLRIFESGCLGYGLAIVLHESQCSWGSANAKHVAVLTGDSHAQMFLPALIGALGPAWTIHGYFRGYCGWAGESPEPANMPNEECKALQAQTATRIRALHPDLVVLTEDYSVINGVRSAGDMRSTVAALLPLASRVVVIGATPPLPNFTECLKGDSDVSGCFGEPDFPGVSVERQAVISAGANYIDTTPWFCRYGECPPLIDGTPVMWGDGHITESFGEKIVPLLRTNLAHEHVLP